MPNLIKCFNGLLHPQIWDKYTFSYSFYFGVQLIQRTRELLKEIESFYLLAWQATQGICLNVLVFYEQKTYPGDTLQLIRTVNNKGSLRNKKAKLVHLGTHREQ